MPRSSFIEGLENRTFIMSATPAPVLFNSTVQLDRIHVKIDLLRFNANIIAGDVKLANDLHRVNKKTPTGDTSLVASIAQLKTDSATLKSQLQQDRLTEQRKRASPDEAAIQSGHRSDQEGQRATPLPRQRIMPKLMADRVQLPDQI